MLQRLAVVVVHRVVPDVLTDTHRNRQSCPGEEFGRGSRFEIAIFIKYIVLGQQLFARSMDDLAVVGNHGGIVKRLARQPCALFKTTKEHGEIGQIFDELLHSSLMIGDKGAALQQIQRRITRNRQFRKYRQTTATICSLAGMLNDPGTVGSKIPDHRIELNKSYFQRVTPILLATDWQAFLLTR